MAEKPVIKIGHLNITDHLILGITVDRIAKTEETFKYCSLQSVAMNSWNQIVDSLVEATIDGAFMLLPAAIDLFKSGVGIKLILCTHKSGSILVKNRSANINKLKDFKDKVVLIPYQLSVHNMLFHRLLAEVGLRPGTIKNPETDVFLEVMAPCMMSEAIQYDEEGEIGGFIVAEPIGSQAIEGGFGEIVCLSKELWPNHPCCVFVVRDEIINKYSDAIHEITESFVKSGKFIALNPSEASAIGSLFLGYEESIVKNVLVDPYDRIRTDDLLPVIEEFDAIQNYMADDMKILTDKIDLEKLVDIRFAMDAGC